MVGISSFTVMIVYLGCVENMFMSIEMRYGLLSE
jgi:hypothetical protein